MNAEEQARALDDLVKAIRLRQVVPIVGGELVTVGDPPVPLDRWLTAELLVRYPALRDSLPPTPGVYDVARACSPDVARDLQETIVELLQTQEDQWATPAPLAQLAGILQLDLILAATFDGLLVRAVNEKRGLALRPQWHSPANQDDVPPSGDAVFHLLGHAAGVRDFALTDDKLLDYLTSLERRLSTPNTGRQGPQTDLDHLHARLRNKDLLVLGLGLPGWVTRFLLRALRGKSFSAAHEAQVNMAQENVEGGNNLTLFLRRHGHTVFNLSAVELVAALSERCNPAAGAPALPDAARPRVRVCILSAPEDAGYLENLRIQLQPLERKGADIWDHVTAGERRNEETARQIEQAHVVMVLLSPVMVARHAGDIDRAKRRHGRGALVIPVLLKPCLWQETAVGDLNTLPPGGNPVGTPENGAALYEVAKALSIEIDRRTAPARRRVT